MSSFVKRMHPQLRRGNGAGSNSVIIVRRRECRQRVENNQWAVPVSTRADLDRRSCTSDQVWRCCRSRARARTLPTISTRTLGASGRSSGSNASPMTACRPVEVATGQKSKRDVSNGYTLAGTTLPVVRLDRPASSSTSRSSNLPRFSMRSTAASDRIMTTTGTRNSASRALAVSKIIALVLSAARASRL